MPFGSLTEEGHADFAEGIELEFVGRLKQRLGVGRVDDQRACVHKLKQQLQHVGADVAHVEFQQVPALRLPRRPGKGGERRRRREELGASCGRKERKSWTKRDN